MDLAQLYVNIIGRPAPLYRTLREVRGRLTTFAAAAGAMRIGLFAGAAGIAYGLTKSIERAATLAETLQKVDVIFGESAVKVTSFADKMADAFGLPKQEMIEAAAKFGIVGKEMGKSRAEAAEFGIAMVKAAIDATSINDTSLDVGLEKIKSGLAGMSRPLRDFGVFLDEANVKIQAAKMGLGALGRELTQGEKIQARAALITKKLGYSVGDLERTQDSAKNQMRKFEGQIENISTALGTALLPAFQSLLIDLNNFISAANKDHFGTLKAGIVETMFVVRNLGTVFQIAGIDIAIEASKITNVFDQIKDKWLFLINTIKANPLQILFPKMDPQAFGKQIFGAIADVLQGKKLNVAAFVPGELGKAAEANKPLGGDNETTKILREMRKELENVLAKRAAEDLKAKGVGPAKPEEKPEEEVAKAKKAKKLDLFSGLEEFAKKLQTGAFADDPAKKTADNTAKAVVLLGGIDAGIKKIQGNAMGALVVGAP